MTKITYVPIIKMSDAELRAVSHLSLETKSKITPIFELTKSRKTKKTPQGDIAKRIQRLKEVFSSQSFILDLTTDPNSINQQIESLRSPENGYSNWLEFLKDQKNEFSNFIPTIQISDEGVNSEQELYDLIKRQVRGLKNEFKKTVYRFTLDYDLYKKDLEEILKEIDPASLIVVLDAQYIAQEKATIYSDKAKKIVSDLMPFQFSDIVVAATSFPQNPAIVGREMGTYQLEECVFYKNLNSVFGAKLVYGDYATINPSRSDQAGGNGWVPRIDTPKEEVIFYYRSRRDAEETTYADAYKRVAEKTVKDDRYQKIEKKIRSCWGCQQIELAAFESVPGLSPSFWISVRMNIHITTKSEIPVH